MKRQKKTQIQYTMHLGPGEQRRVVCTGPATQARRFGVPSIPSNTLLGRRLQADSVRKDKTPPRRQVIDVAEFPLPASPPSVRGDADESQQPPTPSSVIVDVAPIPLPPSPAPKQSEEKSPAAAASVNREDDEDGLSICTEHCLSP